MSRGTGRYSAKNTVINPAWIVIFLLFFSMFFYLQVSADGTVISLQPQASRVWGAEEEFEVNVTVAGVSGLYGWELKLYYDSSLLNGTSITEGSFLSSNGSTHFFNFGFDDNYSATQGRVSAACSLLGNISGVSGRGVLATIGFKTKTLGGSLLTLSDTKLGDSAGKLIAHNAFNGAVEVVPPIHDVAVKNVKLSQQEVAEGRSVEVSVSVANEGNRSEDFTVNLYANGTVIGAVDVLNLTAGAVRNLVYSWNTAGLIANTSYQVRAEATLVPGETDQVDNVFVDGYLLVKQRNHDVAVNRVTPQFTTVFEGQKVNVTVAVANNGAFYETFNVTLYYDNASVAIKNVANLPYGEGQNLIFVWATTGVGSNRSYGMRAVASQVPGETDTLNNTFTDGSITVLPREALSINITGIVPCNQVGQPVDTFVAGTLAYLKVTVKCNSMNSEPLLLTINTYDAGANTIGVISFKGPAAPGETTFILGSPIPLGVRAGVAKVYVNALTDWPQFGGVPYGSERSAAFQIAGR